jgi:hypothetical protein
MSRVGTGTSSSSGGGGSVTQGTIPWADNITQIGSANFSLGQQLAAASLPVVLTAAQITTITPPAAITGFATSALQTTGNSSLSSIDGKITAVNTGAVVISSGVITTVSTVTNISQIATVVPTFAAVTNAAAIAGVLDVLPVGQYNSAPGSVTDGRYNHFQLDAKANLRIVNMDAAGNARGANVDANNNMGVVLPAETTKVVGTVRILGNAGAIIDAATGAAVPVNALYNGFNAQTALPTAATAGNIVGATSDKFGRLVVLPQASRDLVSSQTTTIAVNTETTIVTSAASIFKDIVAFNIVNTSATPVRIDIRDATAGSIITQFYVPATDMRGIAYPVPLPQTTAANNWTAQVSSAVTDIRITAHFINNK